MSWVLRVGAELWAFEVKPAPGSTTLKRLNTVALISAIFDHRSSLRQRG